jgi:hypothetical protein
VQYSHPRRNRGESRESRDPGRSEDSAVPLPVWVETLADLGNPTICLVVGGPKPGLDAMSQIPSGPEAEVTTSDCRL